MMKQEDYILREIEKIGVLLLGLFGKLKESKGSTAITIGEQVKASREMLDAELGFDLQKFLTLKETELGPYLDNFRGMNTGNRELIADLLKEIGEEMDDGSGPAYLEKALSMYHLCKLEDKTFSLDRERKISELEQELS